MWTVYNTNGAPLGAPFVLYLEWRKNWLETFSNLLDIRRERSVPTRGRSTPWLGTLLLIEVAGVGHVMVNIVEIKTHRSGSLFVVTLVDLHYPGVGTVHAPRNDRTVSQCVLESRFTTSNLDHDWDVTKVFTDDGFGVHTSGTF